MCPVRVPTLKTVSYRKKQELHCRSVRTENPECFPGAQQNLPIFCPPRAHTGHLSCVEEKLRLSLPFAEIGVGITGFGVFFILFGILLYFDSVLLAFGNLLFLTGLSLIIGLRRTFAFFFQRHKLKGTSFFLGGVAIVLLRWPLLGMLLEAYGFVSLFK